MSHFWITGGGTREPIDDVRFIGNVSSGSMAVAIARRAARRGHRVTLFLADHATAPRSKAIRVVRFVTAAELRAALRGARPAPDVIVHAAAVADYAPRPLAQKKKSGASRWRIELIPVPKIAPELRRRHRTALLCTFKLESRVTLGELARRALESAHAAGADLVFANRLEEVGGRTGDRHRGLLLDSCGCLLARSESREEAAHAIVAVSEMGREAGGHA